MAAAPAAAAEARAALRRLLRAVDRHLTAAAGNTQWRDHVLSEFRQQRASGGAEAAAGLALARHYAALVESIAHHRALLAEYNLGVDPDERNKRMVEATARRVGFVLPESGEAAEQQQPGQAQERQPGQQQQGGGA